MLAWDYYIIKESKNRFKDWTQAGLEHLRKEYKKLQNKKDDFRKTSRRTSEWTSGATEEGVSFSSKFGPLDILNLEL